MVCPKCRFGSHAVAISEELDMRFPAICGLAAVTVLSLAACSDSGVRSPLGPEDIRELTCLSAPSAADHCARRFPGRLNHTRGRHVCGRSPQISDSGGMLRASVRVAQPRDWRGRDEQPRHGRGDAR